MRNKLSWIALTACVLYASSANATLGTVCKQSGYPTSAWFSSDAVVDIWISTYVEPTAPYRSYSLEAATGLTQSQLATGVSRAIYNWNEQNGSLIWMRYRGFTNSRQIQGAYVITGVTDVCTSKSAMTYSYVNNGFQYGTIEFRKYVTGSGCGTPIPWRTGFLLSGSDFVGTLMHELGHGVFNMAHPGDPNEINCAFQSQGGPIPNNTSSVMTDSARWLRYYDKEVAQTRYLIRGNTARIMKGRQYSPTAWSAGQISSPVALRPLYRMASATVATDMRQLAWLYAPVTGVSDGGRGQLSVGQYQTGFNTNVWTLYSPGTAQAHPVALAVRPGIFGYPSELLMAYLSNSPSQSPYVDDRAVVCFRRSTDGGVVWFGETCTGVPTRAYGLSATYDFHSQSFLIGVTWNGSSATSDPNEWKIYVLTVPRNGASSPPIAGAYLNGITSPHPPSLACGNVDFSGDCIAVFAASATGYLSWVHFTVSTTGAISVTSLVSTQAGAATPFDMPSAIFYSTDLTYRVAITQAGARAYSYKMPYNGTSWTGTGDIYNTNVDHISTVTLGTRPPNGYLGGVYAWFLKYNL